MASNVRQNRTLEAYCCLRGLPEACFASKNEVTSDFCLAPYFPTISQEKYLEKKSILNQPGSSSKIEN